MQNAYVVVDKFFDAADEARRAFEAHFANPMSHSPNHQVWNYWYVPESYTYLRTNPLHLMPEELVVRFLNRLNTWASETLGLSTAQAPWISLYVDGCGQTIHNDSLAGNMGYVFSLTKWETRNFLGGETLLFRPENYWETDRIKTSGAGTSFYEKVPSKFNQLLVFDDRVIHGVEHLQGTMDPLQGRVVMHGHLTPQVTVSGPLAQEQVIEAVTPVMDSIEDLANEHAKLFHGFITMRVGYKADGSTESVRVMWDRILPLSPDKSKLEPFKREIVNRLKGLKFPSAPSGGAVTLPIIVDA